MNAKTAVMAEMLVLWTGTVLVYHQYNQRVSLPDLAIFIALPAGIAVLALAALLTAIIDIWAVEWPAMFGLLIALSALIYEGTIASNAINTILNELVSFSRTLENE